MKLRDNVELWDMVRHEVFSTAVRAVGDKGIRGSTAREVADRILDAVDRALAAPSPGTGAPVSTEPGTVSYGPPMASFPLAPPPTVTGGDFVAGVNGGPPTATPMTPAAEPGKPPVTDEQCKMCNGKGWTIGWVEVHPYQEGCPGCNGTGRTPAAGTGKPPAPHTWIKPAMAGGWTCTVKARGRLDVTCDRKAVVFCEDDHGNGTCLEGRCREHARRAREARP